MDDALRSRPGYLLRRASAAMMADLTARLATLGLRPTEATVLMLIDDHPGITQSSIGRTLQIKRANMAPLAARLSDQGWIAGRAVDGRSTGLYLTDAGGVFISRVRAEIDAHEARIIALIPEPHRAHLVPALKAIWAGAERVGEG